MRVIVRSGKPINPSRDESLRARSRLNEVLEQRRARPECKEVLEQRRAIEA